MDFMDLLAPFPERTRQIAAAVRESLLIRFPKLIEQLDPPSKLAAYSLAPGMKGIVFTLLLSKTGVKLGINRGSELPDETGLLAGTGKLHKYIPITDPDQIDQPAVVDLLLAAMRAAEFRIEAGKHD